MTDWPLKLQLLQYQGATNEDVAWYDDEGGEEGDGSVKLDYTPLDNEDATNKNYVDDNFAGKPIGNPAISGTIPLYNSGTQQWNFANISDPIFNANLLQDKVLDITGISDGYVITYDAFNAKFITAAPSSSNFPRTIGNLSSAGSIGNSQSETNMGVLSLPANTFSSNGKQCVYRAYGTYSSIASNLTLKFKFSSATIATIPVAELIGNSSSSWSAEFYITRVTGTSIAWQLRFTASDTSSMAINALSWTKSGVATTFDFTIANNVFMTGATGAAGSVTWEPGTTLIQTV